MVIRPQSARKKAKKFAVPGKIILDINIVGYIFRARLNGELYLFLGLKIFLAQVAQSVEHILGKDEVTGSIPVLGC